MVKINPRTSRSKSDWGLHRDDGFSLVELTVVILLMAILTVVAIAKFSTSDLAEIRAAAEGIVTDMAYAQEMAIVNGKGTEVIFVSGTGPRHRPHGKAFGWYRHWGSSLMGEPNTNYIRFQDGTDIANPDGGDAYVVVLYDPVEIQGQTKIVRFDSVGHMSIPSYNWPQTKESADVCKLSKTLDIYVARHTGKVWFQ